MGSACQSGPLCGTAQRIALHSETLRGGTPSEPCTLKAIRGPSQPGGVDFLDGCRDGGMLYVVRACVPCRVASSDVLRAKLDELTPAQREYLRGHLQLPKSMTLNSRSDWDAALAYGAEHTPPSPWGSPLPAQPVSPPPQ